MAIKLYKQSLEEVDKTFFSHDLLWEASRIDGTTKEDMIKVLCDDATFFLATKIDEKVVCITVCNHTTDLDADVHTFVLPEYRELSEEILESHMLALEALGYKNLYTVCSSLNKIVKNFLEKRLGFETYAEFTSGLLKVDGKLPTIYRLVKSL